MLGFELHDVSKKGPMWYNQANNVSMTAMQKYM